MTAEKMLEEFTKDIHKPMEHFNYALAVCIDDAYKDFADSLGTSVDELSQDQKKQALFEHVLKSKS